MSVNLIRDLVRSKRFAPRVDEKSLVLTSTGVPVGEAQVAQLNNVAMTNDMVTVWDETNFRLRTTGVLSSKLAYIDVTSIGVAQAFKAVVLDPSKGVSGLGAVSGGSFVSTGIMTVGTDLTVNGASHLNGHVYIGNTVSDNVYANAKFSSVHIKLDQVGISLRRSGADRLALNRPVYATDEIYVGNTSDSVIVETRVTDLYHRVSGTNYKVWDARNHGSGSGLDADLLDGQHGVSYLLRSGGVLTGRVTQSVYGFEDAVKDNITTRTDSGFYETMTATVAEGWPENATYYHLLSTTHLNTGNYYAMQFAANFYDDSNMYVRCTMGSGVTAWKKLWHSGNDGAGSTMDADLLDGQQGAWYQDVVNLAGQIDGDRHNGNPDIFNKAYYYGSPASYSFNVNIATNWTASDFYCNFCTGIYDGLFSVRAIRVTGVGLCRRSGTTHDWQFDTGAEYSTSDQWINIGGGGVGISIYFPAYGGVPVLQADGTNSYIGFAFTVHMVIF